MEGDGEDLIHLINQNERITQFNERVSFNIWIPLIMN